MTAHDLMQLLSSQAWHLKRTILNYKLNQDFLFTGSASFVAHNMNWLYEEEGELIIEGHPHHMNRRYFYEADDQIVQVRFDDDRPFYAFDCSLLPQASFSHLCGCDEYSGHFKIGDQRWELSWRVRGPEKDLLIHTVAL